MTRPEDISRHLDRFRSRYQAMNTQISALSTELDWATANHVVLDQGPMQLRHFIPADKTGTACSHDGGEPLLIVYSHVNRASVVDLDNRRSLIRNLQQSGHEVYLLEWKPVSEDDRDNDLSLYIDDSIDAAVEWLLDAWQLSALNLLGICQGGTFCLCYASLYPHKVARLVTLVTPVDFHQGDGLLTRWVSKIDFSLLQQRPRNVSGQGITMMFQAMRPFDDIMRQVELVDSSGITTNALEFAVKLDQWVYDCPDQPGRAFAQFCLQCFQDNALCEGEMRVGEKSIGLAALTMPVLNVYAGRDHLVPPASSKALAALVGSDNYKEIEFDGGHIGLLVSQTALQTVAPEIGQWLKS